MSIKVSGKNEVAVSIELCFFCGKDKGLLLFATMKTKGSMPQQAVYNHEPCDECKDLMEQGIMICIVKDGTDQKNPDRTGQIYVIRDEAAEQVLGLDPKKHRFVFLEESAWKKITEGCDVPEPKED